MTTDLNTLLTALHVKIDDHLADRRRMGRPPKLTDAELVTLAVAQALLGFTSEARRLRFLPARMPGAFRYLPCQSGCNRRLRAALPLVKRVMRWPAADTDQWTDTTWIVDSTPAECGRSRPTVKRSELAGSAKYGFSPLTLPPVPGPAAAHRPTRPADHRRQRLRLPRTGPLPRRARGPADPPVDDTLTGQLNLEQHGGRTIDGVGVRIAQRLLALTAAIWH